MRAKSSSLPLSGAGKTSGQFLVRMVWSGVMTPNWLTRSKSLALTKLRTASPPRNSSTSRRQAPSTVVVLFAAGAAHDRRDMRFAGDIVRLGGNGHRLAMARDKILGERHHLDHALIGFARIVAEGDDAVLA